MIIMSSQRCVWNTWYRLHSQWLCNQDPGLTSNAALMLLAYCCICWACISHMTRTSRAVTAQCMCFCVYVTCTICMLVFDLSTAVYCNCAPWLACISCGIASYAHMYARASVFLHTFTIPEHGLSGIFGNHAILTFYLVSTA